MRLQLMQSHHYGRGLASSTADRGEESMEFGYFTLSDNHYLNNTRAPNQFIADITDEALYADQLGMHSAWIGEHHFNSLGVLSCPDLVLSFIAARTSRIRLAPAVTVLPLHHPIRVAEQWATLDLLSGGRVDFAAGRGYDRREYEPFNVSFEDNQGIFEEGLELVRKLWAADDRISHHGRHYSFDDVRITPKPVQRPIPTYVASFSKPSIELAARLGCGLIVAPFAAAMSFGGLKQVAELYQATCAKHGRAPGRLMCSYFTHFADNAEQEAAARARQIRYYKECVIPAFPGDPKSAPPSYRYFIDMVDRLQKVRPEDLTENSVLLGSPARIIDTLKKVEAAGIVEVILYFNVGLKPHSQVKEEMDRFMREVAPAFEGAHRKRPAATMAAAAS
jgi:alkanesulfonate monooxygenase SsuD/methylene tetrahydromethanopterin reductase-like flavin-dependent oxidoreductase (luciferase family)